MVEKPTAESFTDIKTCYETAENYGTVLLTSFQRLQILNQSDDQIKHPPQKVAYWHNILFLFYIDYRLSSFSSSFFSDDDGKLNIIWINRKNNNLKKLKDIKIGKCTVFCYWCKIISIFKYRITCSYSFLWHSSLLHVIFKHDFTSVICRRFDPAFASLKATAQGGTLGELQLLRLTSRDNPKPSYEFLSNTGKVFHSCGL